MQQPTFIANTQSRFYSISLLVSSSSHSVIHEAIFAHKKIIRTHMHASTYDRILLAFSRESVTRFFLHFKVYDKILLVYRLTAFKNSLAVNTFSPSAATWHGREAFFRHDDSSKIASSH